MGIFEKIDKALILLANINNRLVEQNFLLSNGTLYSKEQTPIICFEANSKGLQKMIFQSIWKTDNEEH